MRGGNTTYTSDDYTYLAGSVAKSFAAELVLILTEKGILEGNEEKYGYTLYDILHHQNSMVPYTGVLAGFNLSTREGILNILKSKEKNLPSFNYQNITFLILEEIIEEKTGMKYCEALREYILNPLALYNSGSGYDDFKTRWNCYPPTTRGSTVPEHYCRAVCAYEAAAGIFCSAGNLINWAKYIYDKQRLAAFDEKGIKLDDNFYYYNGWYIKETIAYSTGTVIGGGAVCAFNMQTGDGIAILASGDAAPLTALSLEYFKKEKTPVIKKQDEKYPVPKNISKTDISVKYQTNLYGNVVINKIGDSYHLTLGTLSSPMEHIWGGVYRLTGVNEEILKILPGLEYVYFDVNSNGEALSLTIEAIFTENSGVFKKE